jgi:hypothetical protein
VAAPHRDPDRIAALVRAALTPGEGDARPLAHLRTRCWPGGGDRLSRGAVAWLRGWGPHRTTLDAPACACAAGRCGVCN